jgi:GntP family gluconate:H+ symporter
MIPRATASAAAGASIAADSFSGLLLSSDLEPLAVAATMHAGCTVLDSLPHGSFFHATAGAVGLSVKERLRLFPYGTLVGLTSAVTSVAVYLLGL